MPHTRQTPAQMRRCRRAAALAAGLIALAATAQAQSATQSGWAGSYWGAAIGAAGEGRDRVALAPLAVEPGRLVINGAQGAVQLGFLSQGPQMVWGLEGELAFGKITDSVTDGTYTATSRLSSVASLRLRAGVPVNSGLLYVTGGMALAELDYTVSGGAVAISNSSMRAGYDIGAGYEWPMDNGWSLRGEYRYANFGRKTLSDGTNSTEATPDFHALRIGINHRF